MPPFHEDLDALCANFSAALLWGWGVLPEVELRLLVKQVRARLSGMLEDEDLLAS